MGKYIKTNEEYKFFKASKYGGRKDPNEPFFIDSKSKYKLNKQQSIILSLFNLNPDEWKIFIDKIQKRGFWTPNNGALWNEEGMKNYRHDSQYYRTYLSSSLELYLFPYKKVVSVISFNSKKIFKYVDKPDLDEILAYLYTILEDPETRNRRYQEKRYKERQGTINYLSSDDQPDHDSNHHSDDTSTFDNYRYKSY